LARSSRLSTHKNSKLAESEEEEAHLTFVDEDDEFVLEKCSINISEEVVIGDEFLKIAPRVEPLIRSSLISYFLGV